VIAQMVPQAKDAGIALTGPDGPLKALTAQVVGAALDEDLNEHLGCDEHDPVGRRRGDSRNGTRSRTVVTGNVGVIQIDAPRDRDGIFESQLTKKRQRRLPEVDQMVLSLFAKGVDDR
jgi:transposase, mutator family